MFGFDNEEKAIEREVEHNALISKIMDDLYARINDKSANAHTEESRIFMIKILNLLTPSNTFEGGQFPPSSHETLFALETIFKFTKDSFERRYLLASLLPKLASTVFGRECFRNTKNDIDKIKSSGGDNV